jgi:selenocysteine-specific translation elongation factor
MSQFSSDSLISPLVGRPRDLKGYLLGVFGSNPQLNESFLTSVAKKSEAEGMTVYTRSEGGVRYCFLADSSFPEKIQGIARIASVCDYAYYLYPKDGKLVAADGELAVLIDSFSLPGSVLVIEGSTTTAEEQVRSIFKGTDVGGFPVEARESRSSVIDLTRIAERPDASAGGTLIYIDRAFSVKGVGVVVLGFVLSGKVSVHDKLRLIPDGEKTAEVKGIQVSDEDQQTAERGIRVGLSLRGVELKDLGKTSWLDDGSFKLGKEISFQFRKSPFYRQSVVDRDLHVQVNGEMVVAKVSQGESSSELIASLPYETACWEGMRVSLIDLNAKPLRIAGGGSANRFS